MQFLDVTNYIAFRKIFGNANNKKSLIPFLNTLIDLQQIARTFKSTNDVLMKKKAKSPQGEIKSVTTLDEILDHKYGNRGTVKRKKWEQKFKAFSLGVMAEKEKLSGMG